MEDEKTYEETEITGEDITDLRDIGEPEKGDLPCEETSPEEIENASLNREAESVEALKAQISELKRSISELEAIRDESARLIGELGEFSDLFPTISVNELPEEVWEKVKKGVSLSASYALYEKKQAVAKARAMESNKKNASLSAGAAGLDTSKEFFSPSEVKSMSRTEVRRNYSKIMESMKRWN